MIHYIFILIMGVSIFCAPSANAQVSTQEQFGLSMHDTPLYSAQSAFLDYAHPYAPKGGTLKQAAIGSFDTLNPYSLKGASAKGLNLVYDRLMGRVWDEPFTLYPLIARGYEMPEDRSSITFIIDPEARFHDGTPITTDDVLFSYETLKEKGRPNMRRIYGLVTNVTKGDNGRITFTFGDGADRETPLILALMPILSKTWWLGRDFEETLLESPNLNGPYRIAEIEAGRRIIYERVADYWAADRLVNVGHHNFDRVIFDYYRDDTVAFEAFKSGDLDIRREGDAGKWASAYDFDAITEGTIKAEALAHGRPEKARGFIMNMRRPPFENAKVREALQYVLDSYWLNENLFHGQYKRINSYYPNSYLAANGPITDPENALLSPFSPQLPETVFGESWHAPSATSQGEQRKNLRKADELLKEAGWVIQNNRRVNEAVPSQVFDFEILLNTPQDEKIALALVRNLERLGINATIRMADNATFLNRLREYDFDVVLHHWQNSLSPGTEQILYWSCESANQTGRFNYAGICNPAIDELAKSIANSQNKEELVTRIHALDRALTWGHYMIPLYYIGSDYVAYDAKLQRPETTPLYGMVIETWWHRTAGK